MLYLFIQSRCQYLFLFLSNETFKLQITNLEKRLLATEVELLRKIVALYEKQQPQQVVYNYPSSNGVSTGTTNTFSTTSSTMLGV